MSQAISDGADVISMSLAIIQKKLPLHRDILAQYLQAPPIAGMIRYEQYEIALVRFLPRVYEHEIRMCGDVRLKLQVLEFFSSFVFGPKKYGTLCPGPTKKNKNGLLFIDKSPIIN